MHDTRKPYIPEIEQLIRTTWNTKYLRVDQYGVRKKPSASKGPEWRHTDGIGTKGEDHWRMRTFAFAVKDALAMNLNDFARDRAIPFEVCDHIFLPVDDHEAMIGIVSHLSEQCRVHHLAITGGETAIHEGANGLEISITMMGVRRSLAPNEFQEGDVLIGIGSSGLHSNGFTRLHKAFDIQEELPDDIVTPTLIYYDCLTGIDDRIFGIHGLEHITGGSFFKMKKHLGDNDAYIHRAHGLMCHPIFQELVKRGVLEDEMYRTFNCGIGFVIGVEKRIAPVCLRIIKQQFDAAIIGCVTKGQGMVHIESMFSDRNIPL